MAITPILEKWLLTGKAKNRIHHMGYGMFSQLQIPKDAYIVIHKIYWTGFINQKFDKITDMTWKDFFRYSEYALKVQSDKEAPMYYQFRNNLKITTTANAPIRLNNLINTVEYDRFILLQCENPIIFDTFITGYDYLNFTLSRNALMPVNVPPQQVGQVNATANEKNAPFGINQQPVLLSLTLQGDTTGIFSTIETINPPSPLVTPLPMPQDNVANYMQLLDPPNALNGNNGSFLKAPLTAGENLAKSEYVTQPLISFEYCIIQKDSGDLSPL
jgi:hypothetical protein